MSPVFDPSKWSLPVSVVVSMIGLAIAGAGGVWSIHYRLARIEEKLSAHDRAYIAAQHFATWQAQTEVTNASWRGADMARIRSGD